MKRIWKIGLLLGLMHLGFLAWLQASESTKDEVAHCRTEAEINRAKAAGAAFLEVNGWYFVRVEKEYKGPFRSLEIAKIERQKALNRPPAGQKTPQPSPGDKVQFNPLLMIYPFVDVQAGRRVVFTVPSGEIVEASRIMIHPEPLQFTSIRFGALDLKENGKYFALTGRISARPGVVLATSALTFWIGASVVGEDGSILWQHYGTFENGMNFKCIERLENPAKVPKFLLLFTLAAGKLPKMLTPSAKIPTMDASKYEYHILCSIFQDMQPNWFPALEQTVGNEIDFEEESPPSKPPAAVSKKKP